MSYPTPWNIIELQRQAKVFWREKIQKEKGLLNYFLNKKMKPLRSRGLFELNAAIMGPSLQTRGKQFANLLRGRQIAGYIHLYSPLSSRYTRLVIIIKSEVCELVGMLAGVSGRWRWGMDSRQPAADTTPWLRKTALGPGHHNVFHLCFLRKENHVSPNKTINPIVS